MKCFQCGKEEAVFSADCLIVEHTIEHSLNMRTETERLRGAARAGLCPRCMSVASSNCGDLVGPMMLGKAAAVLAVAGGVLWLFGSRLNAPMVTEKLNLVRFAGLVLAVAAGGYLLIRAILAPTLLKKTPWKILGRREGAILNLVPVGDGYYKDYKHFCALNPYLGKKVSEQVYRELIETGAWKALLTEKEE